MSPDTQPLFPQVGVIALVPDRWSDGWQSRHYILSHLAHYFHVVWVNPPDDWRKRFRTPMHGVPPSVRLPVPPGMLIYDPGFLLPRIHHPRWLGNLSFQLRLKRAHELLACQGCTRTILYLWRPEFAEALRLTTYDISCYHIDDEYSFSSLEQPMNESERNVLSSTNQVFIHSPALMERKGQFNPNTRFVPNGVDYEAYSEPIPEPPDLAPIPHPRIGYTGWIKKHLDWVLLLELVEQHPDWSFVLVGPQSPHSEVIDPIRKMSLVRNVYFLGPKPSYQLPAYPQHFDVCIMPYQINAYTTCIYPLKLHEYLASGRPVVGTPIRSLKDFANVVLLADTSESWSKELLAALSWESNTPEKVAARKEVAARHDWRLLVMRIAQTMLERLGQEMLAETTVWPRVLSGDQRSDSGNWTKEEMDPTRGIVDWTN